MSGWGTTRLGELADFRNGLNYTNADFGRGLAVIGVMDFQNNVIADLDHLAEISAKALPGPDALIHKDDIVFVRSNGNRELIGRSLFIKKEPDRPTSHSGFTIRCRFHDARCVSRFYAYLFRGPIIRQTLSAQGGGTNISNLNQGILSQLSVPVPPIKVQRHIASILSCFDDLIENNTRRIAILEEMTRRIFEERFVAGRQNGSLPKDRTLSRLRDIADDIRDPADPCSIDPETPYVGLEHIPRRSTTMLEWGRADDVGSLKLRFRSGDILFGKIRPYFHKAAIAFMDGVASSDAIVIRPREENFRAIVALLTSSDAFVAHAVQTSNGTKMPRADWKVLRDYPIALPPHGQFAAFDKAVWPMIELAATLATQNRNIRVQRDLLLPKLISGDIDVSRAQRILEAAE
jgi:type I restriction enzyme S subunit